MITVQWVGFRGNKISVYNFQINIFEMDYIANFRHFFISIAVAYLYLYQNERAQVGPTNLADQHKSSPFDGIHQRSSHSSC